MGRNNKLRLLSFFATQVAATITPYGVGGREASAGQVGLRWGFCAETSPRDWRKKKESAQTLEADAFCPHKIVRKMENCDYTVVNKTFVTIQSASREDAAVGDYCSAVLPRARAQFIMRPCLAKLVL